jgi:hypothetical protein
MHKATIHVNRRKYTTLAAANSQELEEMIVAELAHITREQQRINLFTEVRVLYHN